MSKHTKQALLHTVAIPLLVVLAFVALNAFAQTVSGSPGIEDFTIRKVSNLITGLACWFSRIILTLMVVYLVLYGLKFLMARGDPTKVTEAKKALLWGLVGIAIIMGTYSIIASVANFLGADYSLTPLDCSAFPDSGGTTNTGGGNNSGGNTGGNTSGQSGIGERCLGGDPDCQSGLVCRFSYCHRTGGNTEGDPCVASAGNASCAPGLVCEPNNASSGPSYTCVVGGGGNQSSGSNGEPGSFCLDTSECISGACEIDVCFCNPNNVCQRTVNSREGEPCVENSNCASPLLCDENSLTCYTPSSGSGENICNNPPPPSVAGRGQLGDECSGNSQCGTGLICNVICQLASGNPDGQTCDSRANPSNCASRACNTCGEPGASTRGECVQYGGT